MSSVDSGPPSALDVAGQELSGLEVMPDRLSIMSVTNDLALNGEPMTLSQDSVDDLSSLPADTIGAISSSSLGSLVPVDTIDRARVFLSGWDVSRLTGAGLARALSSTTTLFVSPAALWGYNAEFEYTIRATRTDQFSAQDWVEVISVYPDNDWLEDISESDRYITVVGLDRSPREEDPPRQLRDSERYTSVVRSTGAMMGYLDFEALWPILEAHDNASDGLPLDLIAGGMVGTPDGGPGDNRMEVNVLVRAK